MKVEDNIFEVKPGSGLGPDEKFVHARTVTFPVSKYYLYYLQCFFPNGNAKLGNGFNSDIKNFLIFIRTKYPGIFLVLELIIRSSWHSLCIIPISIFQGSTEKRP